MSKNLFATSMISNNIPISYSGFGNEVYTTDTLDVSFNISFGKGKDALVYTNEGELKEFTNKYQVETIDNDDSKCYYVIAEEGPLLIKIDNLIIDSRYNKNKYDYAIGFAVDFEEPEYFGEEHYTPFNIERDGVMWSIPAKEDYVPSERTFYQNAKAKYQWNTARAKDIGVELTEDEKELGIEKTSETTGLLYMTFMVLCKEKEVVQERVITRGCNMRGCGSGVSRSAITNSVAGRVGYGHSASSSSTASTFSYAKYTSRQVIPVRIRISKDSDVSDMNCSKTLKGAEVNMERKKVVAAPFLP
jgi:hypothetical protein